MLLYYLVSCHIKMCQNVSFVSLQYYHNGADTIEDQMTLVASTGTKTSMPATLIIRILPVNDEMPVLVNNTGLEVWAGSTSPITNRHLGKEKGYNQVGSQFEILGFSR